MGAHALQVVGYLLSFRDSVSLYYYALLSHGRRPALQEPDALLVLLYLSLQLVYLVQQIGNGRVSPVDIGHYDPAFLKYSHNGFLPLLLQLHDHIHLQQFLLYPVHYPASVHTRATDLNLHPFRKHNLPELSPDVILVLGRQALGRVCNFHLGPAGSGLDFVQKLTGLLLEYTTLGCLRTRQGVELLLAPT